MVIGEWRDAFVKERGNMSAEDGILAMNGKWKEGTGVLTGKLHPRNAERTFHIQIGSHQKTPASSTQQESTVNVQ